MDLNDNRSVLAPVGLMAVMLVFSSIPGTVQSDNSLLLGWFQWLAPQVQNALHIPVYALLAWLWMRHFWGTMRSRRRSLMLTGVICTGFAVVEELYQRHVPGRFPSATDLAFDCLGVALGLSAFHCFERISLTRASGGGSK